MRFSFQLGRAAVVAGLLMAVSGFSYADSLAVKIEQGKVQGKTINEGKVQGISWDPVCGSASWRVALESSRATVKVEGHTRRVQLRCTLHAGRGL